MPEQPFSSPGVDNKGVDDNESLDEDVVDLIASLKVADLQDLALSTHRLVSSADVDEHLSCVINLPPRIGGFHVVYKVSFSDSLCWAIRIPVNGLTPTEARSKQLDVATQRYIASHTSIPIPVIHHFSVDCDNTIARPFTIMSFMPGTPLSNLWGDKAWMTNSKRIYIFEQLAKWVTELSALEFDKIGTLEVNAATSIARVAPFLERSSLVDTRLEAPDAVPAPQ